MKNRIIFIITTLLLILSKLAVSQSDEATKKILSYIRFNKSYSVEKIFLQSNKTFYISGEQILFNLFVFNNSTYSPSDLSKVVFIELINNQNKTVIRKIAKISRGNGYGKIHLPDSLSSGGYMLRCYTNWMKNFGVSTFCTKEIVIINPSQDNKKIYSYCTDSLLPERVNLLFYPEGGNLIENHINQVGIKIQDQFHQGIKVSGLIHNNNGDTLNKVFTNADGIGSFKYLPTDSSNNYLSLTFENKDYSFHLPSINPVTASLNLLKVENSDSIQILLKKNSQFLSLKSPNAYLLVHARGNIKSLNKINLNQSGIIAQINEDSLLTGINHIVLLDSQARIISELCYFKNDINNNTIEINLNKTIFSSRENVEVNLHSTINKPSVYTVCVDPVNFDSLFYQPSLKELLLFNSLNRNSIKNISFYLNDKLNDYKVEDLLLTSKYSSPSWDIIFKNLDFKSEHYPDTKGLTFRGKVISTDTTMPIDKLELVLNFPGKPDKIWFTKTNSKGEFQFYLSDIEGTIDFVLQPYKNNIDCSIKINYLFTGENHSMFLRPLNLSKNIEDYINISSIYKQIENIYTATDSSANNKGIDKENNLRFFSSSIDHTIYLDKFIDLPNMENVFLEIIPSTKIKTNKGKKQFKMFSPETGRVIKGEPTIFVDGVYIPDQQKIIEMEPQKIKAITTVNSSYILGQYKMNGIISIFTKKGNCTDISLAKSAIRRMYGVIRTSNIDYQNNDLKLIKHIPYLKNQLYWNGNLTANENGEGNFNFITSDAKKSYTIKIQGLTKDGNFISGQKTITVY